MIQFERWRTTEGQLERLCGCGEWKPHTREYFIPCTRRGRRMLSSTCRVKHSVHTNRYKKTTDRTARLAKVRAADRLRRVIARQAKAAKSRDEVVSTVWNFVGVDNDAISFLQRATAQWPTHPEGMGFYGR